MSEDIDIGNGILVRLLYYPHARHEIFESIKILADAKYQQREWTKKVQDRDRPDDMPYTNRTLYDDYGDLDDLEVCIRKIDILFYNEKEASLTQDFCYSLSWKVDIDIYSSRKDINYINHPKWPELVTKADALYKIMNVNNEKYNFIQLHSLSDQWKQECKDKYRDWENKFRLERRQDIISM